MKWVNMFEEVVEKVKRIKHRWSKDKGVKDDIENEGLLKDDRINRGLTDEKQMKDVLMNDGLIDDQQKRDLLKDDNEEDREKDGFEVKEFRNDNRKICRICGEEFLGGTGWYMDLCPKCYRMKRGNYHYL